MVGWRAQVTVLSLSRDSQVQVQQTFDGLLVGTDRSRDLAVLQLVGAAGGALQPVRLGSSAGLRVGQACFAIGNPL